MASAPAAPPAVRSEKDGDNQWMVDLLAPIGGQLTLGSTLGYCSGVSLRLAGRMAAVGVGATFCLIQGLAYRGYIEVNWRKVERDYISSLDRDQDGQITAGDLSQVVSEMTDCLCFNLPAGTGFTAGLAYGLGARATTSWKAALVYGIGGRLLLPRVAVAAAGSPAVAVGLGGLYNRGSGSDSESLGDNHGLHGRDHTMLPGYCSRHMLGESEEHCSWAVPARGIGANRVE